MIGTTHVLEVRELCKNFGEGAGKVEILKDLDLTMQSGDVVGILGPSGSGKSTLLHVLGGLAEPTSGKVLLDAQDPYAFPEPDLARFRNRVAGFVFQDHNLLPQYTVLENVLIPTLAFSKSAEPHAERAEMLLSRVGLELRMTHRPAQLSGGEKQRVALARALINQPALLLCDEPTGNLDPETADRVADLLFELHADEKNILVIVTHSMQLARRIARCHRLRNGKLESAHDGARIDESA